jgi:hypothetical protein
MQRGDIQLRINTTFVSIYSTSISVSFHALNKLLVFLLFVDCVVNC